MAQHSSCLVIGGGISGLIAATTLQQQGLSVTVVDKGFGIGGRLASRSVRTAGRAAVKTGEEPHGYFDYGCQFFTAQTPQFQAWLQGWESLGLVQPWSNGFEDVNDQMRDVGLRDAGLRDAGLRDVGLQDVGLRDVDGSTGPDQRFCYRGTYYRGTYYRGTYYRGTYYRGTASTRSVAQHLAQTLDIHNQTRIERLVWQDSQWTAISMPPRSASNSDSQVFQADAVILTAPVPQALELLRDSGLSVQSTQQQQLGQVEYDRCIALLVLLERESLIPAPGGLYFGNKALGGKTIGDKPIGGKPIGGKPIGDASIQWLASNSLKGISPHGYGVTIHATPRFSLARWDDEPEAIAHHLITIAAPWLGSPILAHHLHRWKYSQPTRLYPEPFAALKLTQPDIPGSLILAGDGFAAAATDSSVERAALSGQAAAHYLLGILGG